MTPREKLQTAYELAFHPARLHATWNDFERGEIADVGLLRELLDWALALHQRLPEAPAVTGRALQRLASYQAKAGAYRLRTMLQRFRERVGGGGTVPEEVPAWMVRDIGLPLFGRGGKSGRAAEEKSRSAAVE